VIRHLLKLVWHRKRSTGLLMLEIAVSFLVVFAVALFALRCVANWRRPLGFQWQDVWVVNVDTNASTDDEGTAEDVARTRQLLAEARSLPPVVATAGALIAPYQIGGSYGVLNYQNRSARMSVIEATDDFASVARLHLVAGRFFGRADDGSNVPPVVINQRLARALFEGVDPLGKVIGHGQRPVRVVGVIDEFRQFGELLSGGNVLFERITLANADERPPRRLMLRMAPGTTAAYEPELVRRLAPVAPGWSLSVQPLAAMRHSQLRLQMAPLVVGGVVAGFLLLMVALGLLGVLWQNVTRRTRELGLRRAAGASRAAVHRQVMLELVLVTSLAVVPALLLVVQLPLLSLFEDLEPLLVVAAAATALVVVFALTVSCGLYPSRVATRLAPADALRWE
jgi:putative ABC transport system permease protein